MFETNIPAPNYMNAVPPSVDTSWLAQLPNTYRQGQLAQRQLDILNAPQAATPPGASAPDFSSLTNKYLELGDLQDAGTLMSLGLRQRMMNSPGSLDDPLGRLGAGAQSPGAAAGTPTASPTALPNALPIFGNAIGSVESGNRYDATGPTTKNGDQAVGRYQVMASNVPSWTKEVLGQALTPQQFLASPEAQDAVFNGKFSQYLQQTGNPRDAASMWFTGRPYAQGAGLSDQLGTTGQGYVDKFMASLPGRGSQPGQPPSVIAYAPQPGQAPAQAAIGAATNPPPYRVASNGPVAAPAGSPAAQPASPPPPGFGANGGQPTANTAQSQMVSPAQWAAKFNPNDPNLAGRIADAIGIDPSEQVDVQDLNIRRAVLPVLQASRSASANAAAGAQPPGAAPSPNATTISAQDQPPGSVHPFGPRATDPASGNVVAPNSGAPSAPPLQPPQPGAPGPGFTPVSAPVASRFPPLPVPTNPPTGAPDLPNLPAGYQQPGGGAAYVRDLLTRAGQFEDAGMAGAAKAATLRAQQVQAQLEDVQKSNLDLQTHNAEMTPEQKNFTQMQGYGFTGSPLDLEAQQAQQKADARASANAKYGVVEMQQPDGTTVYVPRAQVLNGTAGGGNGNGPVVKSLPGYVTQGQSALLSKLNDGSSAYQERQVAGERLDALGQLLSTYQTGANSEAFNNAAANLRSIGIPVPDTATTNPAAMQEFAKNAYASVLSAMKEQGNKQFVAEVQSAINSNPNPNLQPAANAAMISQIKGIQDYRDQNFRDYADWYDANKGASNDATFQTGWAKANPLSRYVTAARKEIAPLGVAIPAPDQRVVGQRYAVPGKGVFRWQGDGWSTN